MKLQPKSLYVRLLLITVLATTLSIASLGSYIAYQQRKLAIAAAYQEAEIITTNVATAIIGHMIEKNYIDVEENIKQFAIYPAIKSLQIVNSKGVKIISVAKNADNSLKLKHGGKALLPSRQIVQSILETDHVTTWVPIESGQLIGWVGSDVSLNNIAAMQHEILLDTSVIAFNSILFSILLSSLVLRKPIQQIKKASQFAKSLPEKHSQLLMIKNSAFELNQLVLALNSAAEKLSEQDNELQLLHSLIQYSADPVFIMDVAEDFRMIFINDAACRHFGLSKEELLSRRTCMLTSDSSEFSRISFWQELKIRKHMVFEAVHKTTWSDAVPVEISANYLVYKGKELVAGYFSDISVRKQMEEAVRASESRLQEIINIMPLAVFVKDAGGRFLVMNKVCEQQWGVKFNRIQNSTGDTIFSQGQLEFFLADDKRVFSEQRLIQNDESIWNVFLQENRIIHTYKKPVFDSQHKPLYLIGVSVDITETKQQEENLRLAKIEADRANQAKSEFLANMSHEIRTPMNGVLGMLDLLRDTNMSAHQWDLVDTAYAAAESLLAILNDILDFSKLEAGKLDIETINFNLTELVEDICSLLARDAHAKGLELNYFIPIDTPRHWKGDPNRIRQVLTNLIGNAVKFTSQGEVYLTVGCHSYSAEDNTLRFEVRDTGIGIAPEVQTRLFQPFSQAETNTARQFGGTGLGLSICKDLIELMGGVIGLESSLGKGSCFWFTLPLEVTNTLKPYVPLSNNLDKRILVVDDNATNRTILYHYLTHWGFVAKLVDNGREALQELQQAAVNNNPYDLVLIDMQMPDMDGLAVAQVIHSTPNLHNTPRILLSSGHSLGDAEREELGISQSLLKPVRQSQLFDAMTMALNFSAQKLPAKEKSNMSVTSYLGKKVLVVEDNKVNQKVILGILEKFQIVPDVADNGQIALEKLAENTYDLVLMDCQMPVMNGYQATEELRKFEYEFGLPHQTVIALTAQIIAGEREKCLAAGMDDYLSKPISQPAIAKALAYWLGSSETLETVASLPVKNEVKTTDKLIWNKSTALVGLGGDESLLEATLTVFIDETPAQLVELQAALDSQNLTALGDLAHAIKGTVSLFSADTATACAARLEAAARSGNLDENYQQMTADLVQAIDQLMESFQQFINQQP